MRLRYTIIGLILLLSSCMSTNKFIGMGGANGTKENLPVGVEVLIEMAEYCERIYCSGEDMVLQFAYLHFSKQYFLVMNRLCIVRYLLAFLCLCFNSSSSRCCCNNAT